MSDTFIEPQENPVMKMGIGGNLYVYSTVFTRMTEVCDKIGKSPSSIYWSNPYKCYVIRVKSSLHKRALHTIFTDSC